MDIDDFLDRELFDLGITTDAKPADEKNAEDLPQRDAGSGAMFETIKKDLSKGHLESAEKKYVELWQLLARQKLKWDKKLYDDVLSLTRLFASVISQTHEDIRKKASTIYEMITRARSLLKKGDHKSTFKLYSQVQGINKTIPNIFFDEKKAIQEHIMSFYMEMSSVINNGLIKKISGKVREMDLLMTDTENRVRKKDFSGAAEGYIKCAEYYSKVPEGFVKYKSRYSLRLLEIYKSISIHNEISGLQKQLGNLQMQRQQLHHMPNVQPRTLSPPGQVSKPLPGTQVQFSRLKSHGEVASGMHHPPANQIPKHTQKKEDIKPGLSPRPEQLHAGQKTNSQPHKILPVSIHAGKQQPSAPSQAKVPVSKPNTSHAAALPKPGNDARLQEIRAKKAIIRKSIADNFGG